jgi:hypothetical protein
MERVKIETPLFLMGASSGPFIINALGLANAIGIEYPYSLLRYLYRRTQAPAKQLSVSGFRIENVPGSAERPFTNHQTPITDQQSLPPPFSAVDWRG